MNRYYTDEFEKFWRGWPGRWNKESQKIIKVGKYQAAKAWERLSESDKQYIIKILPRVKAAGTQYLPDAFRWLEKHRWEDFN